MPVILPLEGLKPVANQAAVVGVQRIRLVRGLRVTAREHGER
jgi:hypothetical protein